MLVFVVGVPVLALGIWRRSSTPGPAPAKGSTATTGPTQLAVNAAPVDAPTPGTARHDADGAVTAAVVYVTSGEPILAMDPYSAEEAITRMASTTTAAQQIHDVQNRLRSVHETLAAGSGPIVYRQAVVAWRLEALEVSRARVAVWHVGVLARVGVAQPQAAWATSTVELLWERGDWKVLSLTVTPGPAPILDNSAVPATAEQLAAALDGFRSFEARP